jgi:hypothetical protein
MCYELYVRNRKSTRDQKADKPAPVIEKIPDPKPAVQRQPVTRPKEKQEIEAELETTAPA